MTATVRIHVSSRTELDGVDLETRFTCVCLWSDGRCTYATGSRVNHAMLHDYMTVEVSEGSYDESGGVVSLHLTSRCTHSEDTDEYGWTERSNTPSAEIDVELTFTRQGERELLGPIGQGEEFTLSGSASLPGGVPYILGLT